VRFWGAASLLEWGADATNGSSSASVAPSATVMHYIVLDEIGHCTVVDSKPRAGSTLKIVGDQDGYTSLESADKALKDFKAKCKDVVVAGAEDKFKAASCYPSDCPKVADLDTSMRAGTRRVQPGSSPL
jgi:hypothetical protein